MTVTLYGIKNCDTIKKARKWLDNRNIDYAFHDFRSDGIDRSLVTDWLKQVEMDVLLNTRGTTWRKLPQNQKDGMTKSRAISLILSEPAIIKRPVLNYKKKIYVGFSEETYREIIS